MNEAEWLLCPDSAPMLDYLRGKTSDRELRLFAAACCRAVWPMLTDSRSRAAVEAAERFCKGSASKVDWAAVRETARSAIPSSSGAFRPAEQAAAAAAVAVLDPDAERAARLACGWARNVKLALAYEAGPHDLQAVRADVFARWAEESATLVRNIFGKTLPSGVQERPVVS